MKKYLAIITILMLPLTALAVNVRDGANGNVIGSQDNGSTGTVQGGGTQSGGYYWWNVDFDSGTDGWVAENFLDLYTQTPPPPTGGGTVAGINGPVGPDNTENVTPGPNPYGGTDYFLSCSGNDNNSGTSTSSAWRTLDKLNQTLSYSMSSGTRIMFERGCTYRGGTEAWSGGPTVAILPGSSGTNSQPIQYLAYGQGDAPIISGSIEITNWTQYQGNIWWAPVPSGINSKYLFVNGQHQDLARHPNSGFFFTEDIESSYITDNNNSWLSGQSLAGANLIVKTTPWSWVRKTISSNTSTTINTSSSIPTFGYSGTPGWGYMIENKLSLLDQPGEWYHDKTQNRIYLWAPNNANPNNLLVEISKIDRGIRQSSSKNIVVKNLVFEHFNESALNPGNERGYYENNELRNSKAGIVMYDSSAGTASSERNEIKNNYIHDVDAMGISVQGGDGHLIEGNLIKNVGVNTQRAADVAWSLFGINSVGGTSDLVIRRNIVEDIGYIGIIGTGSGLIEENIVSNPLAITTDGGGIAIDNTNGLTIRKNVVKNVTSTLYAMPTLYLGYEPISKGIYFGDLNIQNTTVDGNILVNSGNDGIWIDHNTQYQGNSVINNVVYGVEELGIGQTDYSTWRDLAQPLGITCDPRSNSPCFWPSWDDVVSGNKIYMNKANTYPLYLQQVYNNGTGGIGVTVDFGTYANNYYYQPFGTTSVIRKRLYNNQNETFNVAQWLQTGQDTSSTANTYTISSSNDMPPIYYNETTSPVTVNVGSGKCDSSGNTITSSYVLQPFTAIVPEVCSLQ